MSDQPHGTAFIVDDDPDMRESLEFLIRSVKIETSSFSSAVEFLKLYQSDWAGCLICDVRMPEMSGLDLFQDLQGVGSRMPVIMMTAYADVPMAIRALKLGVAEFIQKPFSGQLMLEAIQRALATDHTQRESMKIWQDFANKVNTLTNKERVTLDQIMSGAPNKTIAARLEISERAIEVRRASIMKKLGADTFADLVRQVTRYELFINNRKDDASA